MKILRVTLLLAAFMLLLARGAAAPVEAAEALQTNLLGNPSFEQPYTNGVASSWAPWHQETGGDKSCDTPWAGKPQWLVETNPALVLDGSSSEHVGEQFNKWHAGVFQTVTVTPGSTYRFTFWARGRASNEQYPAPSYGFINLNVQARIDPQGRGLWNAADLVYGAVGQPHDQWQQFSAEARAVGNKVTVFVSANLRDSTCAGHMDVWFDKAELVEVGPPPTNTPPPPPPPPAVTNTPVPPTATATPENTPTPENTATPLPPTATATPAGGSICLNAFSDANANGVHDPNEGFMAGVGFSVAQNGTVLSTGVSRGTDNAICFDALPAGNYEVSQSISAALEMTTAPNAAINVENGRTVGVEFGSRIRQAPADGDATAVAGSGDSGSGAGDGAIAPTVATDSGAVQESDASSGLDPLAFVGLGVIAVAVVLLGVLIVVLLRQQRPA